MRVLLVIHDFLPQSRAGSELYTYYLARELAHTGISVELFFAASASQSSERRVYEGLPWTVLHKPLHPPPLRRSSWTDDAFRDCLDRFQPDLVHINHLLYLSLNLPAIAKSRRVTMLPLPLLPRLFPKPGYITNPLAVAKFGAKLIYTATLEMPAAYTHLRRRADQVRALTQLVDLWVSPSQFLRDLMIGLGLPRERMVHVPNGLPTSHLPATEIHSRAGRLHFGFLGTIAHHKGVHILMEAFRGIRDADLTVWGGPPRYLVDRYRDVLDQNNVRFPGVITDDQKAAAFSSIDALIVPSIWFENAPLVILGVGRVAQPFGFRPHGSERAAFPHSAPPEGYPTRAKETSRG